MRGPGTGAVTTPAMEDKMDIRKYAKSIGFDIIGKLKRLADSDGYRIYIDDGGNEYQVSKKGAIVIIDADGAVW